MNLAVSRVTLDEETLCGITALYSEVWVGETAGHHRKKARWAFGGNSLGRGPLIVARASDVLIGVRGSIMWRTDLGDGTPGVAVQLHGAAVDPTMRRQGIFNKMTLALLEEIEKKDVGLIYSVSVDAVRAGNEKLGWTYNDSLRSLVLPLRPDRIVRQVIGKGQIPRNFTDWSTNNERPPLDRVEPLLQRRDRQLSGLMHTVYDEAFYGWRFGESSQWIGSAEGGYVVYRLRSRGGVNELLVGDVWPGKDSVARLIARAVAKERPDLVLSWTTEHHPHYKSLRRMGFITRPRHSLNLGLRMPDGRPPTVKPALMAADIDTF